MKNLKCSIVMAPTQHAQLNQVVKCLEDIPESNYKKDEVYILRNYTLMIDINCKVGNGLKWQPQHFYIISDRPIVVGKDYVYNPFNNDVIKAIEQAWIESYNGKLKRIEATSDISLNLPLMPDWLLRRLVINKNFKSAEITLGVDEEEKIIVDDFGKVMSASFINELDNKLSQVFTKEQMIDIIVAFDMNKTMLATTYLFSVEELQQEFGSAFEIKRQIVINFIEKLLTLKQ